MTDKRARLAALGAERRTSPWDRYNCIGDYHDGAYECDFVSPYTKTAGNVDSEIFVMLQDWASHKKLDGKFKQSMAELGHDPGLLTNKNLVRFLKQTFGAELSDVYATNLFPFVKMGKMSDEIEWDGLVKAAHEFGLPQISIVRPRVAVCLGVATYGALREACGLNPVDGLDNSINSPFDFDGVPVWCQAHTGYFGQLNRNGNSKWDPNGRAANDWRRMKLEVM